MSTDVKPSDWTNLDPWWSAYEQSQSVVHRADTERVLGTDHLTDAWDGLGRLWRGYTASFSITRKPATAEVLRSEELTESWDILDPWWDVYVETGHETAAQIADLLKQSNAEWENSEAPFDTDPLAADLTRRRISRGPLQPSGEVNWSRWLAQVLRPSAALVTEVLDVAVSQAPKEVVREAQLSKGEGTFRRPDILAFHPERGISIEVKLGDENYRKTAETAALVERHYPNREWSHALLLPRWKQQRLADTVEPPLNPEEGGPAVIEWDDPGSIDIVYWRDITGAIRSLLRRGEVPDDHWAASAYLFCAVAEQQIMGFQPQPVVSQLTESANVVDTVRPIMLADTLTQQLTYLRTRAEV